MDQPLAPIIAPEEALRLSGSESVVIVDARTGEAARARYTADHLEGALFVDLDTELADIKPDAAAGGRHPLPDPEKFIDVLNRLGISPSHNVLVYDDKNATSAAARFWWMLRAIGHQKVQVIDGGMQAAIRAGFSTNNKVPQPAPLVSSWNAGWSLPIAGLVEVSKASVDQSATIIDVRSRERYDGDEEPIDLVAGHIPGAKNIPFTNNLDHHGRFRSPDELQALYAPLLKDAEPAKVIVHCGSGVTACHSLLAIAHAGFNMPRLYVGSWSEWSRNDLPVATRSDTG